MNHYERSALNFFAANPLDRLALKRRDPTWLLEQLSAPTSRIVPVWQSKSLLNNQSTVQAVLVEPSTVPALLSAVEPILLGAYDGVTYFAVDLSATEITLVEVLHQLGSFQDLWSTNNGLDAKTAAILAYAKGMAYWHQRHRFCGDCGSPTESRDGGFVRKCTNPACAKQHFPRTDPAIIVLVHADEKCLLARQASWPAGRYSVVAGFVEPGESLEDAVKREVGEETNITVASVQYHSSQPWPFPGSLMIGYTAEASSFDFHYADEELEHARWFSRAEIVAEIEQGTLKLPPNISISHRLIESWFDAGEQGKLSDLLAKQTGKW
ncbi:MAG: NAD(+) diphosphatase [Chloroflexi bacterium]|nr:NAD(+) diphosphatase [Chloroflexota bacterium]